MPKLNLACGFVCLDGYINCDISKKVQADKYFDITKEWPVEFENDSADEILLHSVVGLILENKDFLYVMNKCHDVLKDGHILQVMCPSARFPSSFKDPFEVRHFTEETWTYFDKTHIRYQHFGEVYGFKPWTLLSVDTDPIGIMTIRLEKWTS